MTIVGVIQKTDHTDTVTVDGQRYHINSKAAWFVGNRELWNKRVSCEMMEGTSIIMRVNEETTLKQEQETRYHEPNTQGLIVWQNHMTSATQIVVACKSKTATPEELAKKVLEITDALYTGTEEKFL